MKFPNKTGQTVYSLCHPDLTLYLEMDPKFQYKLMDVDKITWLVEDGHMSMACYEMFNEAMESEKGKTKDESKTKEGKTKESKTKDKDTKSGEKDKETEQEPLPKPEDVKASWCFNRYTCYCSWPVFPCFLLFRVFPVGSL